MNAFAKQLDIDVTYVLDIVAPLCMRTKCTASRFYLMWMTMADKDARCLARRLERLYSSTKEEVDYVCWRKAGRLAVKEMNNARVVFYQNCVQSDRSDPKSLWCTVKKICVLRFLCLD